MALDMRVFAALIPFLPLLIWMYFQYWVAVFSTWKKRGIPHIPGVIPHGSKVLTKSKKFQGDRYIEMYRQFPNDPYFGAFENSMPLLFVKDPEIIRLILAKEFSHFRDRSGRKTADDDYLTKHLFNLEGDQWRTLRTRMTPVFTSGKLKTMFPLFVKCSESLSSLIYSNLESDVDIKDVAARFSTDVICSCAFGLEVDSIKNSDNPFRVIGSEFMKFDFRFSLKTKLKVLYSMYFPMLKRNSALRITPKSVEEFIMKAIKDTIEHREKTGYRRDDFIDLLMEIRDKGNLLGGDHVTELINEENVEPFELTFESLAAQCFVFFVAGFETSSSVVSLCLYEMAINQDIQERLHQEIVKVLEKHKEITYQAIKEMKYLDMVVNETMRKYPTLTMLSRKCTIPFVTPYGHKLEKGDSIVIPVWALHHDPQMFPEPDKFDPERFSPENRETIHPFSFLPFGEGPRICIGSRFGLLQTKMGVITILRKYKVNRSPETPDKLKMSPKMPVLTRTEGPILLRMSKRDQY